MKKENKIKFNIITLACKVNQYGSAVLGNILSSANFVKVEPFLVPDGCEQFLNTDNMPLPQKLIGKIINYKL
jgi:hypothetical protein